MKNIILTSSFNTVATKLYNEKLIPQNQAKVAFVTTAAEVYKEKPWLDEDRKLLTQLGYKLFDVDLKDKTPEQLETELSEANIIFVAGGNTTYLFHHANKSGFCSVVKKLLQKGVVYIGSSAGSILAGPSVEPFVEEELPDLPPDFVLSDQNGIGLVDYIILPHYPKFKECDDIAQKKFGDKFKFELMSDDEYKIESI